MYDFIHRGQPIGRLGEHRRFEQSQYLDDSFLKKIKNSPKRR